MATKDDRPGLLSKVAMFVRNPTKDWAELSRPDSDFESSYDKQALKAMIERKRQNDFVRKREFDQLRKLRNRDTSVTAALARPSVFHSSIVTDSDGRAVTLKKIDEIEAQMSKQWWKGKHESVAGAAGFPVASSTLPNEGQTFPMGSSPTAPLSAFTDSLRTSAQASAISPSEYPATQMGTVGVSTHLPLRGRSSAGLGADSIFSTSKLFALESKEVATDPDLEEAAIRFANGDDAGAEAGLLAALQNSATDTQATYGWATALLDLYIATNNRARFDWAVVELAHVWNGVVPMWRNLEAAPPLQRAPAERMASAASAFAPMSASLDRTWSSPAHLTAWAMEDLREAMATSPMPWLLDWSALQVIDAAAMPLLDGLFASLCAEPVALRFMGADALLTALAALTPSGQRAVDPAWWIVRLNVLRTMHMLDMFELVALDYCVTFEVSPPAWEPARCDYAAADGGDVGAHANTGGTDDQVTVPMDMMPGPQSGAKLSGEVLGDAGQVLAALEEDIPRGGGCLVVSCRTLVRVDFSAAGSILNWAVQRQSEGYEVEFSEVHRLVAAFFNVIGIHEYARVTPRIQ